MASPHMEAKLAFFKAHGYYIEHGALSKEEVATVNAAIAVVGGSSADAFHKTTDLDLLAYHPNIYPLARHILGDGARLSSFNYGNAAPNDTPPPADPYGDGPGEDTVLNRAWHREDSGNVEGAAENEYYAPALQVFFYLDDVDELGHCTSVIPESAATKRSRENPSVPSSLPVPLIMSQPCLPGISGYGCRSGARGLTSVSS